MTRTRVVSGVRVGLLSLIAVLWLPAATLAPQETQQQKPAYTMAEYNAYQAAANEKDAQQRIKLLDDFVAKYPSSTLLPYAYRAYYTTYNELKNYPKVIEYVDKLLAFGDKIDAGTRLEALYTRALAFHFAFNEKDPNATERARQAREAALQGSQVLGQLPKPQNMTDEQFAQNKKGPTALFNYTAGFAALQLKDYKSAIESFKGALAANPNDPVTYFRMGVAYLQQDPPQSMGGFWALARSIALKGPGEAQVRDYLRKQLLRYQNPACENLIDSQMNELLALAANSPERPASYNIPSSADLDKARQEMNILSLVNDLKAGGDKAKLAWLGACGLEFPQVGGKVIAVEASDDAVVLKVYTGATEQEIEAATTPNMDVKVIGQAEAKRIEKDQGVRFTGMLVAYDPEPFLLHWDKAKVNPEDIPEEKPQPGTKRTKRPIKRPGH